jgi:hypothetical protein
MEKLTSWNGQTKSAPTPSEPKGILLHFISPLDPIWSQMNPVYAPRPAILFFKINFNIERPPMPELSSDLFPSGSLTNNMHDFLLSVASRTRPLHHIFPDLFILSSSFKEYDL